MTNELNKIYLEILVLEAILGVIKSIKDNSFSIDEAERALFMPWVPEYLKKIELDSKIIDLIWQGIELEDVKDLCTEDDLTKEVEKLEKSIFTLLNKKIIKKENY